MFYLLFFKKHINENFKFECALQRKLISYTFTDKHEKNHKIGLNLCAKMRNINEYFDCVPLFVHMVLAIELILPADFKSTDKFLLNCGGPSVSSDRDFSHLF